MHLDKKTEKTHVRGLLTRLVWKDTSFVSTITKFTKHPTKPKLFYTYLSTVTESLVFLICRLDDKKTHVKVLLVKLNTKFSAIHCRYGVNFSLSYLKVSCVGIRKKLPNLPIPYTL